MEIAGAFFGVGGGVGGRDVGGVGGISVYTIDFL